VAILLDEQARSRQLQVTGADSLLQGFVRAILEKSTYGGECAGGAVNLEFSFKLNEVRSEQPVSNFSLEGREPFASQRTYR
jgi:hypothetical protein